MTNTVDIGINVKDNTEKALESVRNNIDRIRPSVNALGKDFDRLAQAGKMSAAARRQAEEKLNRFLEDKQLKLFNARIARIQREVKEFREAKLDEAKIEEFSQRSRARAFDQHLRPAFAAVAAMAGEADEEVGLFDDSLGRAIETARGMAGETGSLADQAQRFLESFVATAETTDFVFEAGKDSFEKFRKSVGGGLDDLFSNVFRSKLDGFSEAWSAFTKVLENSFRDVLARMASALVQENILAPALKVGASALGGLIEAGKGLLGLAKGGVVTRPTVALLGEAGPEAVIPLERLGVEKAVSSAVGTAAARAVTGIPGLTPIAGTPFSAPNIVASNLGVSSGLASVGLAGAGFLAADVLLNEATATRAVLGALGFSGFRRHNPSPAERGAANVGNIANLFSDATDAFGGLGFTLQELIDRTGGNPGLARLAVEKAVDGKPFLPAFSDVSNRFFGDVGDAAGRFIRSPSLRLVGEAGPEHVLNVDSPQSVRALREGLRPIVRELFAEEGRAGRAAAVSVDLRGAFFPDGRSVEKLFSLLEGYRRSRRVSRGPALSPA